jgi:uncharacterized membrane protein YeiH
LSVPYRASDYLGTLVFAFSGSVTAGLAGMDVLGSMVVRNRWRSPLSM